MPKQQGTMPNHIHDCDVCDSLGSYTDKDGTVWDLYNHLSCAVVLRYGNGVGDAHCMLIADHDFFPVFGSLRVIFEVATSRAKAQLLGRN
jgi:hypothetical protein